MATLRQLLQKKLPRSAWPFIRASFDVVGSIAIVEIPEELRKHASVVGEALLRQHKNIRTVAQKVGIHGGKFRTQKLKIIAGEKTKTTEYKENNVRLQLDVEKVYFSARLSTERKRIIQQVKKGERILVMFSGCGPYPLVLSKNTAAKEIYGIEMNPVAHRFAEKNVVLNKAKNVVLLLGDVRKVTPTLKKKFDRILMPLPKGGEDFLGLSLSAAKKGAIIHFYDFEYEKDFSLGREKVRKACRETKKRCHILKVVKCGQYSPRNYRICVDFKVV